MNTSTTLSAVLPAAVLGAVATAPPPATDRSLRVTPSDAAVHLAWEDVGAASYDIVRDGTVIATVPGTRFDDAVSNAVPYEYDVLAGGVPVDPLGPLTVTAADTTVDPDTEVSVRVARYFEGGAQLLVQFPRGTNDVAAVQVRLDGELASRVPVGLRATVSVDVWGLAPAALDGLTLWLEDLVGNTTQVLDGDRGGLPTIISVDQLHELPLPPVAIRVETCTGGTRVTWDTFGASDGRFAVRLGDDDGWTVVDEPRALIPEDARSFQLATFAGHRLSEFTPTILHEAAGGLLYGGCMVAVSEPSSVEGVTVTAGAANGIAFGQTTVAGSVASLYVHGASGVAGARVHGAPVQTPFHVGSSSEGRWIHVPLRAAEVTPGSVWVDIVGIDGETLETVAVDVPPVSLVEAAVGGVFDVTLDGAWATLVAEPVGHDREVLRDGEVVGHLPAGASVVAVDGHAPGVVHAYQLRGVGQVALTSEPVVVVR